MKNKNFELDMFASIYSGKASKPVPLDKFIKNWKKMEKRNHIPNKFSLTNTDF